MKPRGRSAVMAGRHEAASSLDDFPTPPWAVRALCEWLGPQSCDGCGKPMALATCREPAAGRGHMVRTLRDSFGHVEASDVFDYGAGEGIAEVDYLARWDWPWVDWTITNPPFRLAADFARVALATSTDGVALLVRLQFLEGLARLEELFGPHPPFAILQFAERVPMFRGRLDRGGSTATAYCWVVWMRHRRASQTQFVWLPRCRRRLERDEDYAS